MRPSRLSSPSGTPAVLPALLAIALLAGACGGGEPPAAPDTVGNGNAPQTGERITGSERLGWTQSDSDAGSFTYALYVDGARIDLKSATCRQTIGDQHDCSAPLPSMSAGPHRLELTATRGTQESPRSQPLAVVMSATSIGAMTGRGSMTASVARERDSDSPHLVCSNNGNACYTSDVLAWGIDRARALAPSPDDRVFLVSRDHRVLAVSADGRIAPIDVDPPCGPGQASHLAALAVSPGFVEDRAIFAAWVCEAPGERVQVLAVSYRELGGSLGEAQVLPLTGTATRLPRLSLGDAHRLYLSTDQRDVVNVYRVALSESALILQVPEQVARGGPNTVIAASPSGVFVMDESGIGLFDTARRGSSRAKLLPDRRQFSGPGNRVSLASQRSPGPDELIWLADPLQIRRLRVMRGGNSLSELGAEVQLDLSRFGSVTDFAAGYHGDLYALIRETSTSSYAVLRLDPR